MSLVNLSMNRKGAEIWADMTRKASLEVNEAEGRTAGFIAIVLDEKVISAPRSANEITEEALKSAVHGCSRSTRFIKHLNRW